MIIGGKDRCDYRAFDDRALIEEARYNPNVELCVALGERLEDCTSHDADRDERIRKLEHRLIMAQAALESMRAELGAYEEMFSGKARD